MTNFDENYINRYLFNQLNDSEKKIIQDKMQVDKILQNKVKTQMNIMQATQKIALFDVKKQIKNITKNWEQYVPELTFEKVSETKDEKLSIEMVIDGLANLYNQFFRPYSVSFRKASSNNLTIEENAFELYKKEAYQQAIPLLKQLPNENIEAQLMLGNALLITQKFEQALKQFIKIVQQKTIGYTTEAKWFAGLTLLNLDRLDEAKLYFKEITFDKYAEKKIKKKAIEILEQIEKVAK